MNGIAVWSSPEWRAEAVGWLDERLAAAGLERRGAVEQPHLRPWATALRAPTTGGTVWLKAPGPGTAFEVRLYELLARVTPDRVLTPIAVDPARQWILLPDGGPSLGQRLDDDDRRAEALAAALVPYAELQRELAPHVDDILTLGVSDMRPAAMPERFAEALDVTAAALDRHGDESDRATHRLVTAQGPTVAAWCEQRRLPGGQDRPGPHLGTGAAGRPGAGRADRGHMGRRPDRDPGVGARRRLRRRRLTAFSSRGSRRPAA